MLQEVQIFAQTYTDEESAIRTLNEMNADTVPIILIPNPLIKFHAPRYQYRYGIGNSERQVTKSDKLDPEPDPDPNQFANDTPKYMAYEPI